MLTPVLATFALVMGIILGAYWLVVFRPESAEQRALRKRLKGGGRRAAVAREVAEGLLKQDTRLSEIAFLDRVLRHARRVSGPAQRLIEQSGLSLTVGVLVLLCAVSALAVFVLVSWGTRLTILAAVFGALAAYLPVFVVQFKAKRRVALFEEQFPEAIDLLSRSLRAGHAFTTGLSLVAEEMPDPVGTEFRLAYDRQNFGMPLPDALRNLGERVPLLDAKFFVTAVLTQRDAGGNLSEVLDNLANVIRERFKVKRQTRVTTAHARVTGWVLALLPPSLAVVLTVLSPQHMSVLWTDPVGIRMVVAAIVLQVIGTLIIRKLVDVEY